MACFSKNFVEPNVGRMTTLPPASGFSRFQAIVTATSREGYGPPVLNTGYLQQGPYTITEEHSTGKKRKRDSDDEDDGNGSKTGKGARKATVYTDQLQLLTALRERFQQSPHVEFHGYCEIEDPGVTHRQRVQSMTHEIWKATGYRFTVKDHPRVNDGHKTRFWCSQDDAHKSKASRNDPKPRLTSTGDIMAKTRYPCKSRLLISSRESGIPGRRIITIRLAHHLSHEPYVDSSLMPDMVKSIWESFGWAGGHRGTENTLDNAIASGSDTFHHVERDVIENGQTHLQEMDHQGAGVDERESDEEIEDEDPESFPTVDASTILPPPPPPPPPLQPDIYHQRMRCHIANIRDFCDGLEYQLQFNDTRMLEVVEREGQAFLKLVTDCLQKENRLVSVPEALSATEQITANSSQLPIGAVGSALHSSVAGQWGSQ
ncbi:hypothetical protein BKA70DRAFT_1400160 [Coprinopsis sp. MPI-PUGE-AT-0042]|nr:hypothetical protein BKA70DRAFT_1400160 [Coprinopsis sp. MPI-PUGE-AT-0042]